VLFERAGCSMRLVGRTTTSVPPLPISQLSQSFPLNHLHPSSEQFVGMAAVNCPKIFRWGNACEPGQQCSALSRVIVNATALACTPDAYKSSERHPKNTLSQLPQHNVLARVAGPRQPLTKACNHRIYLSSIAASVGTRLQASH